MTRSIVSFRDKIPFPSIRDDEKYIMQGFCCNTLVYKFSKFLFKTEPTGINFYKKQKL